MHRAAFAAYARRLINYFSLTIMSGTQYPLGTQSHADTAGLAVFLIDGNRKFLCQTFHPLFAVCAAAAYRRCRPYPKGTQ